MNGARELRRFIFFDATMCELSVHRSGEQVGTPEVAVLPVRHGGLKITAPRIAKMRRDTVLLAPADSWRCVPCSPEMIP